MKAYFISLMIFLNILFVNIFGQNSWELLPPSEGATAISLSIDSLKSIIISDSDDLNSNVNLYEDAVLVLLNFYKESEASFLIQNLNISVRGDGQDNFVIWQKYYIDAYAKGILGVSSAIDDMNSIAQFCSDKFYKMLAIRRLSEIGKFDYWDVVKENKNNPMGRTTYICYAKDERYKNEIRGELESEINSLDINNWVGIISISENIMFFDSSYGLNIIKNKFENSNGRTKLEYFIHLGIIDPENQPQRSISAIANEENDELRAEYIPRISTINLGMVTKNYLTPFFVNFLTQHIQTFPGSITYNKINGFINKFLPPCPDSTTQTYNLLNNLYNYVDSVFSYSWLGDLTFSNELKNILTIAKTNLQNGDSLTCRVQVKAFQDLVDNVYKDSLNSDARFVTIEGWKFLYWNAQYILDRLPELPANPNLLVNLKNSLGNQIPANNVTYYENSWKDAVNNGDGTFTVITTKPTISIRVYYEYASLQADNVTAQNNSYTFTTVNAAVQLKNSLGYLIDQGTVQYYAGAWRTFGTTSNGVATKELLPINYSFRMTYEYGSIDKQQNLSSDPTVVFQTVNAAVQLKNSLGNFIDQGIVQYYAGAWRSLGTTNSSGIAKKELLPANISFRATVGNVSLDKQQDISVNNLVEILLNTP